ncbi:hypothetical protein EVAR_28081_1 [Eumeta japonica]|uniref:Uncharacterized protein n=1 Tax=Eumeta variegata TaxID=151549 RepID=A0A4C1W8J0_EUMVA|nr:hypothetical protein EVAR_28081_1 [Eumeta japonica]
MDMFLLPKVFGEYRRSRSESRPTSKRGTLESNREPAARQLSETRSAARKQTLSTCLTLNLLERGKKGALRDPTRALPAAPSHVS